MWRQVYIPARSQVGATWRKHVETSTYIPARSQIGATWRKHVETSTYIPARSQIGATWRKHVETSTYSSKITGRCDMEKTCGDIYIFQQDHR